MARVKQARLGWLTVLAALLALLVPAGVGPRAQGAGQGLIQGGSPPDMFLLYTGDVIGHLGPCG